MPQHHLFQHGTFHVTTSTRDRLPLCTMDSIPQQIIDHLCETRGMQGAHLYAFCILPDHLHFLLETGPKGLSAFLHAFKKNSSRNMASFFWQKGYHDELIRDGRQRSACLGYIQGNAMKHGLVEDILSWPWTSLHFEHLLDPMEICF